MSPALKWVLLWESHQTLLGNCNDFLDTTPEPPAPNCSCHINPPCEDCVEHSAMRELFASMRASVKKAEALIDAIKVMDKDD